MFALYMSNIFRFRIIHHYQHTSWLFLHTFNNVLYHLFKYINLKRIKKIKNIIIRTNFIFLCFSIQNFYSLHTITKPSIIICSRTRRR